MLSLFPLLSPLVVKCACSIFLVGELCSLSFPCCLPILSLVLSPINIPFCENHSPLPKLISSLEKPGSLRVTHLTYTYVYTEATYRTSWGSLPLTTAPFWFSQSYALCSCLSLRYSIWVKGRDEIITWPFPLNHVHIRGERSLSKSSVFTQLCVCVHCREVPSVCLEVVVDSLFPPPSLFLPLSLPPPSLSV